MPIDIQSETEKCVLMSSVQVSMENIYLDICLRAFTAGIELYEMKIVLSALSALLRTNPNMQPMAAK